MNSGEITINEIKQWDILVSLDPSNAECSLCKGNALQLIDDVCPSCADDILFMVTGCRFGDIENCDSFNHPDC